MKIVKTVEIINEGNQNNFRAEIQELRITGYEVLIKTGDYAKLQKKFNFKEEK